MPQLLIFAPCEKVLIDQATNSVSLVGVLQEVHYKVQQGQPTPPQNASLPINWTVLSLWQEELSDAGIDYEQKILLEDDAGTRLFENIASWRFTTGSSHRILANVTGLPISRRLSLHLFYRVAITGNWTRVTSFPIVMLRDML